MSKLDDILIHDAECMTNRTDLYKDCTCVCVNEKKNIKLLMLELYATSLVEVESVSQHGDKFRELVKKL